MGRIGRKRELGCFLRSRRKDSGGLLSNFFCLPLDCTTNYRTSQILPPKTSIPCPLLCATITYISNTRAEKTGWVRDYVLDENHFSSKSKVEEKERKRLEAEEKERKCLEEEEKERKRLILPHVPVKAWQT